MPPLVNQLRHKVKDFRDNKYVSATQTSKSLLNWWFGEQHLMPHSDGTMVEFKFVFVDQECYEKYHPKSFTELIEVFRQYKS